MDFERPIPPRKGDRLFRDDLPDWHNNACLNATWGHDEAAYQEGYRRGARLLVEHVVEHARDQDFLAYPIIFLYRHNIELALKSIILQTPYIIDRELTDVEKQHLGSHRLDPLWQDLKPLFANVCKAAGWDRLEPADIEGVDDYIRQLSEMDRDFFAFRYTRSKQGCRSLPADVKRINLRHFAELVERLADYLEGLDAAVYSLVEAKSEMEAEYRREMAQYMDYA